MKVYKVGANIHQEHLKSMTDNF